MRQHLNIHQSYDDPCQRFFNAIGIDSYIRPHRHLLDPKTETLIALKGKFALVCFGDAGKIVNVIGVCSEKYCDNQHDSVGVELQAGVWHTIIALTPDALLLELKAGPFVPTAAKEFAPWAPEEGTAEARAYLASLHRAANGLQVHPAAQVMAA